MENIYILISTAAAIVTIVRLQFAWLIAKKQGIFSKSNVIVSLFDLTDSDGVRSEIVIAGPHSECNILTPVLIRVKNDGPATAQNIEITIESQSCTIVNHPYFFISPAVTHSTVSIEGNAIYLGNGIFRRVFNVDQLNPGKSIQLNNAGLPRNILSDGKLVGCSSLSVAVYERGKAAREFKFAIWFLDTSKIDLHSALKIMSQKLKLEYLSRSLFRRFIIWLKYRAKKSALLIMEITNLREVNAPSESEKFFTVSNVSISYGCRFATGNLLVGQLGII